MDLFGRAHDGIDGTGRNTKRAANTGLLFDERYRSGLLDPVVRVERLRIHSQQSGQLEDTSFSAGGTLIDIRPAFGNRRRVGPAAAETALAALGLRQNPVDFCYEPIFCHTEPE